MHNNLLHKKITVFGKVQGVAFRKYTHQMACKLKITGYVQNQENGSVYIEAEGTQEQLDRFIIWCHQGSPYSKVEKVELKDGALNYYPIFEII